ncbi:hypothetical protein AMTRI_Chr07g31170 [Amborella trichopoda]
MGIGSISLSICNLILVFSPLTKVSCSNEYSNLLSLPIYKLDFWGMRWAL